MVKKNAHLNIFSFHWIFIKFIFIGKVHSFNSRIRSPVPKIPKLFSFYSRTTIDRYICLPNFLSKYVYIISQKLLNNKKIFNIFFDQYLEMYSKGFDWGAKRALLLGLGRQEMSYFINQNTGRVQHPPKTLALSSKY